MTHANLLFDNNLKCYVCTGNWSIFSLNDLLHQFETSLLPKDQTIIIRGESLTHFDSAGALMLLQCIDALKSQDNQIELTGFNEHHHDLLAMVSKQQSQLSTEPDKESPHGFLYRIGKETVYKINQVDGLIALVGDLTYKMFDAFKEWRRFQYPSIVSNIASAGLTALPIVGLLSFLIGVVLAYQMGIQLETYGASNFIAYLSGMAIFREFAPLITAIIVAGRTSSAFTAQIGSMKINEEIDALLTMGLSPTELLVVPKVVALLFIFPLLIFWSDFFATLGAMMMSKFMLHVGHYDFLSRLRDTVGFKQMMLGLYKAPTFAILIALVGCFQGFRVKANADSVGTQTTKSVVQALFLIIITDATYSVVYSWLNL